jgi:hypothetical protein
MAHRCRQGEAFMANALRGLEAGSIKELSAPQSGRSTARV